MSRLVCVMVMLGFFSGSAWAKTFSLSDDSRLLLLGSDSPHSQSQRGDGALRALLQQQPAVAPKCYWEDNQCYPDAGNWLSVAGMPSSPYRRANILSSLRLRQCLPHKTREPCSKDAANRCYWWQSEDGKSANCRSADFVEMRYYSDSNFTVSTNTIPLAMTCPGTKAWEFYSCAAHPAAVDMCESLPGCTLIRINKKPACFPAWIDGYTQQQFDVLIKGLEAVDPKLYGSCAGACWITQAGICSLATNTNKATCWKHEYCSWDSSTNVCFHTIREIGNAVDRMVYDLYDRCFDTDNQRDCEANLNKATTQQESAAIALWSKYTPDAKPVQCSL